MKEVFNKNKIIIIAIIALILIFCLIFVFYNKAGKTSSREEFSISVNYKNGKEIELSNIQKGQVYSNKIIVSNNADDDMYYSVKWVNVSNKFNDQNKLIYKLDTHDADALFVGNSQIPITSCTLSDKVLIRKRSTHTYELTINFDGDTSQEKENMFKGAIEIKQIPKN